MKRVTTLLLALAVTSTTFSVTAEAQNRGRRGSSFGSSSRRAIQSPRTTRINRSFSQQSNRPVRRSNVQTTQSRQNRIVPSRSRSFTTKARPQFGSTIRPRPTTTRPTLGQTNGNGGIFGNRPRPFPKPIDPGIGNGRPTTRPTLGNGGIFGNRPRPGMNPTPRPLPKPIDPGIGNGRPTPRPPLGNGGIFGNRPRPFPKPLDPGIGNGRPNTTNPPPRGETNGDGVVVGPRPRPRPNTNRPPLGETNEDGVVVGPRPRPRPNTDRPPLGETNEDGVVVGPRPRPRPRPPIGTGPPAPRPPVTPPIDPGIGNGQPGHGHHGRPWNHNRPRRFWWWANFYRPLYIYRPIDYGFCDYSYATCNYQSPFGLDLPDTKWYLGIGGIILPGKGFAIEKVDVDSPAELAGLTAGMIITECNGITIIDNNTFSKTIAQSNGLLEMVVLESADAEPAAVTVKMERLVTGSY